MSLKDLFEKHQTNFKKDPFPSENHRRHLLKKLKAQLIKHEEDLVKALNEDYGYRSEFDSVMSDILPSIMDINHTLKKMKSWMKPSKRSAGMLFYPSKVEVRYQPLGVVGIVVPWNFPIYLAISPLVSALSAGNRAMIKLSEFTPKTNKAMTKALDPLNDFVTVVEGDSSVGAEFTELPFDHILFTGSTKVGRLVAQAAAKNLTPVTLELGGKSPAIVTDDMDISAVIDSLVVGKTLNAGQICVAPDYVLLPQGKTEEFISLFKKRYQEFYENSESPTRMTSVLSQTHYDRLSDLLSDAVNKGAQLHGAGERESESTTTLTPQILTDVNDDMLVMQEEIFGPILPIMEYKSLDEAIDYIQSHPKPLALYIMSKNSNIIERLLTETQSGGVCVNDTIVHVGVQEAPFGGIGESGMGHYHGVEGFQTFSKAKTVMTSPTWASKYGLFFSQRERLLKMSRKLFY